MSDKTMADVADKAVDKLTGGIESIATKEGKPMTDQLFEGDNVCCLCGNAGGWSRLWGPHYGKWYCGTCLTRCGDYAGIDAEITRRKALQQKRPPCDACGAESCQSIDGFDLWRGIHALCATCWSCDVSQTEEAIARRAQKQPEFYGTMPARDELPETLPDGTLSTFGSLYGLRLVEGEYRFDRAIKDGRIHLSTTDPQKPVGGWYARRDLLDWSRIPRQSPATQGERARLDDGREAECRDVCGVCPICARYMRDTAADHEAKPEPVTHFDRLPSGTHERAAAALKPDPYARRVFNMTESRIATAQAFLDEQLAEIRAKKRIAALTLDLDRPIKGPKYPESWPEHVSTPSWEDD